MVLHICLVGIILVRILLLILWRKIKKMLWWLILRIWSKILGTFWWMLGKLRKIRRKELLLIILWILMTISTHKIKWSASISVRQNMINFKYKLSLIMKKLFVEFSASFNFSAKIIIKIWRNSYQPKSTKMEIRKLIQSTLSNKLQYYWRNCLRLWIVNLSWFQIIC